MTNVLARQVMLRRAFRVALLRSVNRRVLGYRPIPIIILMGRPRRSIHFLTTRRRIFHVTCLPWPAPLLINVSFFLVVRVNRNVLYPVPMRSYLPRRARMLNYRFMLPICRIHLYRALRTATALIRIECNLRHLGDRALYHVSRARVVMYLANKRQEDGVALGLQRRPFHPILMGLRRAITRLSHLSRDGVRTNRTRE